MRGNVAEIHLFVDQIEDDLAVLIEDTEESLVPLRDLPKGTQEGVWLTVEIPDSYTFSSFLAAVQDGGEKMPAFVLDEATGMAVKKRVQSLMDELSG